MPVEQSNQPEVFDEVARRDVVKQRASELKRALLESTLRIAPGRVAAAYNDAARKARVGQRSGGGSSFMRFCVALLSGALSMLIPFASTCSLRGQLAAATVEASSLRAMVYAHPLQCAQLSLDEPASVTVDGPAGPSARFEARITRVEPQAGSAEVPACHIELQWPADSAARELPAEAALTVVFATQPRTWLALVMDKAASDSRLRAASTVLRGYSDQAWRQSLAVAAYVARNPDPRHYWAMLQEIFRPDEDDAAAP